MTIPKKKLHILMVEVYAASHLSPAYMWEFFIKKMSHTIFEIVNYVRSLT